MKRLTILLAAALLLSACGSSARRVDLGGPRTILRPPSPTALRFSTAANRRFAREDVQRLIRILELPPGARLVARVPKSAPTRFGNSLTGTRFVRGIAATHRIWIVREPLGRVVRFVRTHAHPRPRPEARFRGPNYGISFRRIGSYAFPPVPGRSWVRWLNAEMLPLSRGATAVIAQAGDGWIHEPHNAPLPRSVKRIDVVSRSGDHTRNVLVHVRAPYDVGSIVALVNGLGLSDPEHVACPWGFVGGPTITFKFRTASGKLIARATVTDTFGSALSGPCNPVQITGRGRQAPPLIGADLLRRVQQLLDVDLAPPSPRDVSDCLLRLHRWTVRSGNHLGAGARNSPPELSAARNGRHWTITFHYSGKVTLDKPGPRGLERCIDVGPRHVVAG